MIGVTLLLAAAAAASGTEAPAVAPALTADEAFPTLDCVAEQTGGFHDYPDDADGYQPALFNSVPFRLEENAVFMLNLAPETGIDRYLTLTAGDDPVTTELECRQVRGIDGSLGFSCVNIPPSEMLLIHAGSLRFTRTAVGGWTFAAAAGDTPGDSIFVEYGSCRPVDG